MFNLVYLEADEREELRIRREERDKMTPGSKEYKANEKRVQEIESHRKALRECDVDETLAFRKFLGDKIRMCRSTGKLSQVVVLEQQLLVVDNHLRTVRLKGVLESEVDRRKREEERVKAEAEKQNGPKDRRARARARKLQNQWTIDIGDLD